MRWIDSILKTAKTNSLKPSKTKWFIGMIAVLLLVLNYRYYPQPELIVCSSIVGVYLIISLFIPKMIQPLLYGWLIFGGILGEISGTILLAIVYFAAAWPMKVFIPKAKSKGWIKPETTDKDYQKPY